MNTTTTLVEGVDYISYGDNSGLLYAIGIFFVVTTSFVLLLELWDWVKERHSPKQSRIQDFARGKR